MSQQQSKAQPDVQAGPSGETAGVGPAVGGVHSSEDWSWLDLTGVSPEMRAWLKAQRRDSARSQACQRGKGQGDGSVTAEIITPEKVRKLQRALYRKAKAEPKYRFWSLYGDIMRRDLLEHALQRVARNKGGPGVDGQGWVRARFKGWLWRKHGRKKGKWKGYPDDLLHGRYKLWRMPTRAAWKDA